MKEKKDEFWFYMWGLVVAANVVGNILNEKIPRTLTRNVQYGYAVPREIKIKLDDRDKNGKYETYFIYEGRRYPLRLDENGNPKIQPYEIRSTDVLKEE